MLDPKIGASTGNVLLLNERQNLLTRMIGTYYWIGLNINKHAQSVIRSVVCCSGCRHLTNLVPKRGFDVVYVAEAVSWLQILIWDLSAPFLAFGLRIGLIVVVVVTNPPLFFTAILPSWIFLLLIRYIFVPLRAPESCRDCSSTCSSTRAACG